MPSPVSPAVRSLIVCEDIILDPDNSNRVSLVNLIGSIRPTEEPPYPHREREFCVFVQLAGCRGKAELRIDVQKADTNEAVFETRTRTVSFPNDPIRVHGLRFRIRNCLFLEPALYWVQFYFDGKLLAQQPIILC